MALQRLFGKIPGRIAIAGMLSLGVNIWIPTAGAASRDDAYVRVKKSTGEAVSWELGNSRIQLEITYAGANLSLTGLRNLETDSDWTPPRKDSSISQDLRLHFQGEDFELTIPSQADAFLLSNYRDFLDDGSPTLELTFRRATLPRLQFSLYVRIHPDSLVEMWSELQNQQPKGEGEIKVSQVGSFRIPVSEGHTEWKIADVDASIYKEPFTVEWVTLTPGAVREQPFHASTYIRTFFLKRGEKEALIGGPLFGHRSPLGFGAPGLARFSRAGDGATLTTEITQEKAEMPVTVKGDQFLRGLGYVFGFSGPKLSAASYLYQDLTLRFLSPPPPDDEGGFPWIEHNPYFGYDLGFSARVLKRDVDLAASLGAEVFIIDAGWQVGALEKCEIVREFSDYLVTAGEYRLDDASRFPKEEISFKDFARYVHAKGLRFGLWFCPFNIDPHKKTDWRSEWLSGNDRVLCAADREAANWALEKISKIVTDYHVDFLKFDCQTARFCSNPSHDTTRRFGEKVYAIPAYYGYTDLINRLRSQFPWVSIEANPNIGHVQAATDDFDLSPASGRVELYKARFHTPPRFTAQYLMLEPPAEKGWTPDAYLHHMKTVVRSNMLGHVILSSELSPWRPRFRALVKEHLATYKRFRRVLAGKSYDLLFDASWEATQFQDPSQGDSLLFLFRNKTNTQVKRLFPKGLSQEAVYSVSYADRQEISTASGRELMEKGLSIELDAAQTSEIVFIQSGGPPAVDSRPGETSLSTPCSNLPRAARPGGNSGDLRKICAPFLEGSDPDGWTIVYRNGSDFNPDTYDFGFDPNLGDVHIPMDRISEVCPGCEPPGQPYCRPGVWNCQECPKLIGVPGHPDSDLDGLPNWWEDLSLRNLFPRHDEDGDGLANLTEYRHMTDPFSKDTDGDGWSDALELASFGTDPLLPDEGVQFLFVAPESECEADCGSRDRPYPGLAGALSGAAGKERTFILLAAGLVETPSAVTILPGSLIGIFGGFEVEPWERGERKTLLQNPGTDPIRFRGGSDRSQLILENLTISGGIRIEGSGKAKLARLTVAQAESQPGLEIRNLEQGIVLLTDSFIEGNQDGVVARNSRVIVQNCTILNNQEAALRGILDPGASGHVTSVNNILSGNGRDLVGVQGVFTTACNSDPRCTRVGTGAPVDETTLLPANVLRDSGVSTAALSTYFDLAGNPRLTGSAVDLGAVEVQDRSSLGRKSQR